MIKRIEYFLRVFFFFPTCMSTYTRNNESAKLILCVAYKKLANSLTFSLKLELANKKK